MLVNRAFFSVLAVLILFTLTGCSKNPASVENNVNASENPTNDNMDDDGGNEGTVSNAKVQVNQSEDGIFIVTDKIVHDFEYIKISHEFIGDSVVFFVDSAEYAANELTPEEPFKPESFVNHGTMPQYGVSFVDADNVKKYFYILESGMDGSLSLVEFENNTDAGLMASSTENPPSSLETADSGDAGDLKFSDLAGMKFIFSSGVGAWHTQVEINPDGTFAGIFSDANMGETGDGYPNGTIYSCSFSGRFSSLKKIDEYEYSMKCESLTHEGTIGDETISDGVRYVISEPYGFDNADIFFLYLPGKRVDELPVEFLEWVSMPRALDFSHVDVIDFWGLYNAAGKEGFSW